MFFFLIFRFVIFSFWGGVESSFDCFPFILGHLILNCKIVPLHLLLFPLLNPKT